MQQQVWGKGPDGIGRGMLFCTVQSTNACTAVLCTYTTLLIASYPVGPHYFTLCLTLRTYLILLVVPTLSSGTECCFVGSGRYKIRMGVLSVQSVQHSCPPPSGIIIIIIIILRQPQRQPRRRLGSHDYSRAASLHAQQPDTRTVFLVYPTVESTWTRDG